MKYTALILCVFLLITACTSKKSNHLSDYPAMKTIFSEQELVDLQSLLNSFEQEIGIQADASPEAKVAGYSVFNKQVLGSMEEGNLDNYPLSNEQKINLLDVLHVATFRSVWSMGAGVNTHSEKRPYFEISPSGKFIDLLAELAKEYPQFTELANDFERAGGLSPTLVATLFMDLDAFNLKDARIRLAYAISCLQGEWRN